MGYYFAVYKCPLCGKEFRVADNPVQMEENRIPELIARVVKNQKFVGNQYLYEAPMYLPHQCGNGDGGIAQLIGFKKVLSTYSEIMNKLDEKNRRMK